MSQIIRSVKVTQNSVAITKSFTDFIPLKLEMAMRIIEEIANKLKKDGTIVEQQWLVYSQDSKR